MMKENNNRNSGVEPFDSHQCGISCLGHLCFHHEAVGDSVRLSHGGLLAKRTETTFKNGLVFSNRPIKIQERIRLRVEEEKLGWFGALRLGFTNVPPTGRSLPLPPMAIPDLTTTPGHWAAPVHEDYCEVGSELQFWVSAGGTVYISSNNSTQHKLLEGVDLSQPLWAMIDVYGQTCSIFLLGSEKRGMLHTRRSCPVPEHLISPFIYIYSNHCTDDKQNTADMPCLDLTADTDGAPDCVVCMVETAGVKLSCGHRCLCSRCAPQVVRRFGVCPLCRRDMWAEPPMSPTNNDSGLTAA